MQKERRQGGGGKLEGDGGEEKYNKIQTLFYPRKSHILMQGPIPLLVATISFVERAPINIIIFTEDRSAFTELMGD